MKSVVMCYRTHPQKRNYYRLRPKVARALTGSGSAGPRKAYEVTESTMLRTRPGAAETRRQADRRSGPVRAATGAEAGGQTTRGAAGTSLTPGATSGVLEKVR